MGKSTQLMVRKRQRAREAGLCITCCKRRTQKDRSVCLSCTETAHKRSNQRRERLRRRMALQHVIESHENAGDVAYDRHLYEEAAEYYKRVLSIETLDATQKLRLSEKLVQALFHSGDPKAANVQLDDLLSGREHTVATTPTKDSPNAVIMHRDAEKTAELLLLRARNYWIDCRTKASLALVARAMEIARKIGSITLQKKVHLMWANVLIMLGRFSEAARQIEAVGPLSEHDDVMLRVDYRVQEGNIANGFGHLAAACNAFEEAARLASEDADPYLLTIAWGDYALSAIKFRDFQKAKACTERALLVARRNHILWRIPQLCLDYAAVLTRMGQFRVAHEYLLEALSYQVNAPILETAFAAVGIPIALYLHDRTTLAKCARSAALDLVFQSAEPVRTGLVVAAFSRLYTTQGKRQKAQVLLRQAMSSVHYIDESFEFIIEIARVGSMEDVTRARALLESRTRVPSSEVAGACLCLFDAFIAHREERMTDVTKNAFEAMGRFEELQWHEYANLARFLLPRSQRLAKAAADQTKLLADMKPALSHREEEVVQLVLCGLTNREIAIELDIREHTVEKHMSSIMNRMGIRSRHQLVDFFARPENNEM